MQIHGRAKLGPAGRLALCQAIESGVTFRGGSAERWASRRRRRIAGGIDMPTLCRQSDTRLAWAADRSSRPRRSPGLLDAGAQERICEARRHTGWGPRLIAGKTGHPHSTVWKVLHRHGLSQTAESSP